MKKKIITAEIQTIYKSVLIYHILELGEWTLGQGQEEIRIQFLGLEVGTRSQENLKLDFW